MEPSSILNGFAEKTLLEIHKIHQMVVNELQVSGPTPYSLLLQHELEALTIRIRWELKELHRKIVENENVAMNLDVHRMSEELFNIRCLMKLQSLSSLCEAHVDKIINADH